MKVPLILVAIVAIACSGCAAAASTAPSAPATASAAGVVCDQAQFAPPPTLTCAPAVAAAVAALPAAHPPIIRQEFRWGGLCAPGASCAPPLGDQGIVIFDFASGPSLVVYVSAGNGGAVASGSPAPYPSGY
jgi:hypothetical protein